MKASSLDLMRFPELLETDMYVCRRQKNARRLSRFLMFESLFVLEHQDNVEGLPISGEKEAIEYKLVVLEGIHGTLPGINRDPIRTEETISTSSRLLLTLKAVFYLNR